MINKIILFFLTSITFMGSINNIANSFYSYPSETYEIYPTPHNIEYGNEYFNIKDKMNIIYKNDIDEYNILKTKDLLASKDILIYKNNNLVNYPNLYLSTIVNNTYFLDLDLTNIDSYYLKITNSDIYIIGKDNDAISCGLATLEYVFNAVDKKIRTLEISDYSDSKYRGFIEGFYGNPWSSNEVIELLKFGSKNKANIYIYAPKDDMYHSSRWRDLYDEANLKRLEEQIRVGNETKTRFCYALHPFINSPINASNYSESMEVLFAKLNQVYELGCRQFCISGDDAVLPSNLTSLEYAKLQNKVLNEIAKWNKEKGDTYDLIFVPSAYCYKSDYWLGFDLNEYFLGLLEGNNSHLDLSIDIMWTGNDVCSTLEDGKLEEICEILGDRLPFIWMNYPANDYNPKMILMGPGEVYSSKKFKDGKILFSGIGANLGLEEEMSKSSLFAALDYAWNVFDFDVNKSYRNSFKYIENTTYESLLFLAEHFRNTGSLFSNQYFSEAEHLLPLIEKFNLDSSDENIKSLIDYFDKLYASAVDYLSNSSNKKLLKEISPWVNALKYASKSANCYLNCLINKDKYSTTKLNYIVKEGDIYLNAYYHQNMKSPNAITYNQTYVDVDAGILVLRPFLSSLNNIVKNNFNEKGISIDVNYGDEPYVSSISSGTLFNMIDEDLDSGVTFKNPTNLDSFYTAKFEITLDYHEVKEINKIDIYQGSPTTYVPYLDCMRGKILISEDGFNYKEVCLMSLNENSDSDHPRGIPHDSFTFESPLKARYIKLANYYTVAWICIREIVINEEIKVDDSPNIYVDGASISYSDITNLFDLDLSTYALFKKENDRLEILLDLFDEKFIESITISYYEDEDLIQDLHIYHSLDGISYSELKYEDNSLNINAKIETTTKYIKFVGYIDKDIKINQIEIK